MRTESNILYIKAIGKPERQHLIDFLEEKGYRLDEREPRSRTEIIEGFLPIYINQSEGIYRMVGNVTCAAAAASTEMMISADELYKNTAGNGIK